MRSWRRLPGSSQRPSKPKAVRARLTRGHALAAQPDRGNLTSHSLLLQLVPLAVTFTSILSPPAAEPDPLVLARSSWSLS